jgi:aryl-alcohol dehydrogenase-like predicted oxidoreductase
MGEMTYRQLGSSGLTVSVVGLGCNNFGWRIGLDEAREVLAAALDEGITLLDTADMYGGGGGSETMLGELLVGGRRDQVVLATKFGLPVVAEPVGPDWLPRGSRRYVRQAVEASLRRLRTDWIDLYQYHQHDGVTPLEETIGAMAELVTEGKVRYIGSSNLAGWQVVEADFLARAPGGARFVSAQNDYSLLERGAEQELVPACLRSGVGILPYFPLASGKLTGKVRRGQAHPPGTRLADREVVVTDSEFDRIEALERLGAERGLSLLDVAIGGLAAQPAVGSVIAGATSAAQVRANAAAGRWQPSADDLAAIDAAAPHRRPVTRF